MIRINCNFRKFGDQFQRLTQYILRRNIFRVVIISIKGKDAALHSVHDVGIGSFHDYVTDKTTAQIFHLRHHIQESGKFIFIRQFSEDQKIDGFLEPKTSAFQTADQIMDIDALII